ncbi:hypothetical protein GUJ93_ZPchr0458g22707 [Zizania palustris]|uniref:Uncharacterized protein n=1 Tax=Zizania palustris TaxID=103762 RepID=A0A8J5RE16_ZIZPA|nr:hypothetical protein GUJ93_ZPchr0458g22707 [Zizania palustris]
MPTSSALDELVELSLEGFMSALHSMDRVNCGFTSTYARDRTVVRRIIGTAATLFPGLPARRQRRPPPYSGTLFPVTPTLTVLRCSSPGRTCSDLRKPGSAFDVFIIRDV